MSIKSQIPLIFQWILYIKVMHTLSHFLWGNESFRVILKRTYHVGIYHIVPTAKEIEKGAKNDLQTKVTKSSPFYCEGSAKLINFALWYNLIQFM